MPINKKIDVFIQFVRRSKKGIFTPLIILSIVSVILIIGCLSYSIFYFYSKLVDNYYETIMYDIYDYQNKIISKNNYRNDIANLSRHLLTKRGVKSVWVVDRNGKCVFHSKKAILEKYLGRNLPIEYYNNINVVWRFEDGYPVIAKGKVKKLGLYRLSIPLYPFGRDYFDFILGIDVSFMPFNLPLSRILIFIVASALVSMALIFFPLWFLINKKFNEISTQAMILGGTLKVEHKKKAEPSEPEERVEEDINTEVEEMVKEEEVKKGAIKTEKAEEKEKIVSKKPLAPVKSEAKGETVEEKNRIKEKLEKMEAENPNIRLLELKQSVFRRKKNELSQLIVESIPYHSGTINGSYVSILEKGNYIWPLMFSYYMSGDIVEGYEIIKGIYNYLNELLNSEENIKAVCSKLNEMYLEKGLVGDFTLIKISENGVEYTALGDNYAIYQKGGKEKIVKELVLGLPPLGEKKGDLMNDIKVADIRFERNDLIIAMPSNAKKINVNNENLDIIVRRYVSDYNNSYEKMIDELNNFLKTAFRKDRKIEETGFINIKFI